MNAKSAHPIAVLSRRTSGVLLHVTSLPGKYGIGDLGPAAYQWVDMLAGAGQTWWQMLPLGPSGEGNSPYRCYSAFAGNPLLISPDFLLRDKLIDAADLQNKTLPGQRVDFAKVTRNKMELLHAAHRRFRGNPSVRTARLFDEFVSGAAHWLDDAALFFALRDTEPEKSWTQWPNALVRRKPAALAQARVEHADAIDFHKFVQFVFFTQLNALRAHARKMGVQLIGDLPIFVSPESADVWTHPHLFLLNKNLQPRVVSGVPPDLFSVTGQCWGNPLYDWKKMTADKFAWWKARLKSALSQADLVRIDHFRGFESCWTIPAGSPTAQTGKWVKCPGESLFHALIGEHESLPLLAEDLGIITPPVEALRDRFKLPGMRVLQFGFSPDPGNPHSPHNFIHHCFAYTGTHDNDTAVGWYSHLPASARKRLQQYAPDSDWPNQPAWALIRLVMASVANHAIVPLQDILSLNGSARMNTPGESSHNWEWRLGSFRQCRLPLLRLRQFGLLYDRCVSKKNFD